VKRHLVRRSLVAIVCLWIGALVPWEEVRAQTPLFFDDIGCGPRAIAMGQAFTAVADDASAAYYNPAGLVQIKSPFVLDIGYQYIDPKAYIKVLDKDGNPYEPHWMLEQRSPDRGGDVTTGGIWLGITSNFAQVGVFNDPPSFLRNLAMGATIFYTVPEVNRFWNPQRKQDPYHMRYNNSFCLLSTATSLAYRITDWLSMGGGILARMDTFQNTEQNYIDLYTWLTDPEDSPFRLRLKTEVKIRTEYVLGILVRPPVRGWQEKVSLGVVYRRELSGYYGTGASSNDVVYVCPEDGPCPFTRPDGEPGQPGDKYLIYPLKAFSVDYIGYNPAQIAIGLAVRPVKRMLISADVTWKDYSEFQFFWALPPEPRFNDTWTPRVGLEYCFEPRSKKAFLNKFRKISLMSGYYFEPTPVPEMNGEMNILDSDKNVVSFGFSLDYLMKSLDIFRVQAYFQMHILNETHLHNRNDPLFGEIWTGGEVYSTGITIGIEL
jgi:long-subunit fatty acid transport protein